MWFLSFIMYHIEQLTLVNACVVVPVENYRCCIIGSTLMAAAVRLDSSITLTTALKRPISSPKLAVSSETKKIAGGEKTSNSAYPVPHCVLLTRLENIDSSSLLESMVVSEEAIALMVKELGLENLQELPELHLEFSDWPVGIATETR